VLAATNLEVVYDDVMLVLRGVSLEVPQGRIVALLGANGAGKSTLLRAVSGLLGVHDGVVSRGSITLDGEPIHNLGASRIAALGIKQVMEGRRIFVELTVEENLRIGAHVKPRSLKANLDRTYALFPVLADRRRKIAGYLSGGEQQMLAIGRALMQDPKVLLVDELSMGLAPVIVESLLPVIRRVVDETGAACVMVEQHVMLALEIADTAMVLAHGDIALRGDAKELAADEARIERAYLGRSSEA